MKLIVMAIVIVAMVNAERTTCDAVTSLPKACEFCEYCQFRDYCNDCPCDHPDQFENCGACKYCKWAPACTLCDMCVEDSFFAKAHTMLGRGFCEVSQYTNALFGMFGYEHVPQVTDEMAFEIKNDLQNYKFDM